MDYNRKIYDKKYYLKNKDKIKSYNHQWLLAIENKKKGGKWED